MALTWRAALLLAALAQIGPAFAADPAVPRFTEEAAAAGVDGVYAGEWQYMVGGGAAAFDCDDDGFADLFLAGGEAKAGFYRNRSASGGPLKFERAESGLELDAVTGAYPLDIDNDGTQDLVLLRVGENLVMRGLGQCRFEPANVAWGFDGGDGWSTAFAATWEKGAQWPTLAVGNYIDRREETSPWGSCTENWLHRPNARGFAPPLPLVPSHCALSMLFTDWNRSGTPSLRVSNDREYYEGGQEQMWHVEPNKAPVRHGEAEGWKNLRIWGMGIAHADLDFDGFPEYFLTSMADQKLQTLATPAPGAPPAYRDVAFKKGVTAHRPYRGGDLKPSTGWHAQFEDVNNDGRADLFIAKGNVDRMPDFALNDPNNLLLQREDGTFMEAGEASGVGTGRVSRGAALEDFNLDGLIDIVVVNRREKAELWRNTSAIAGQWIALRLRQDGPNRDAVGAWVEVKLDAHVFRREITVGGGHAGGQMGWRHFGLGALTETEVRVIWPDGTEGPWQRLAANGFHILARSQPAVPWVAPR